MTGRFFSKGDLDSIVKVRAIAVYTSRGTCWRYVAEWLGGTQETIRKSSGRLYPNAYLYDYDVAGGNKSGLALRFAFGEKDRQRTPAVRSFPVLVEDERANLPRIDSWNTRNLYSKDGQQIAAMELDFVVYFHDAGRGITGKIHDSRGKLVSLKDFVTARYQVDYASYEDANEYKLGDHYRRLKTAARGTHTSADLDRIAAINKARTDAYFDELDGKR
jgi:hypothetical protein